MRCAVRQARHYAVEEPLLFEFPGFWGTTCEIGHCASSPSASVNGRFHIHAGPQHEIRILVWLDQDFHRNALHDFDEISGGVLRRQQGLPRTGRSSDGIDHAFELFAIGIHVNANFLTGCDVFELRFLEIRGDVDLIERDDGEKQLSGRNVLAQVHGFLGDLSGDRGGDVSVGEIQLGLLQRGLGALDGGQRGFVGGFGDGDLLLARFGLHELRFGARHPSLCGTRVGARNQHCLLRGGKLLLSGSQIAFGHARGGFHGIELIFGDVVGAEQRCVAGEIALRAFVGGAFGGDVSLGDLKIRGGGLFELRLGAGVIGGIGFLLMDGAAGAVGGGFARQADLNFRGICLGFGEIEIGFGLFHFGFIFAGINLHQEVA